LEASLLRTLGKKKEMKDDAVAAGAWTVNFQGFGARAAAKITGEVVVRGAAALAYRLVQIKTSRSRRYRLKVILLLGGA
jgi:hypothetical protein